MRSEGVKGHLDLLLLGVLSASPGHGYSVITYLRTRSDGMLELTEGSVYPALHRLEDKGLLTSDWQPVAGRRRRVYRVTDSGAKALQAQRRDWEALVNCVEAVLRPVPRATAAVVSS
jgi:PadR family transcriptional regulator